MSATPLSWFGIVRLGLVQMALGAVVILATSTMNRVMVVELGLPAILPGALVAWHYALQVLRPGFGHGSDVGGRRTSWIIGGMAVLALGGAGTAVATASMSVSLPGGVALALVAFTLVGIGVGASGTSLLVLLAKQVAPQRRAAAASIVWIMMIAGFVITAAVAGRLLDPFSPARLVAVTCGVAAFGFVLTVIAVWRIETPTAFAPTAPHAAQPGLRTALAQVWAEDRARRFAIFVFLSMLAYGAQELLVEPFAGLVFALTPGESARLAGLQHGGVLAGMLLVGICSSAIGGPRLGSMRLWTIGGCAVSAAAVVALACVGLTGFAPALHPIAFVAGAANGAFSIAAIGTMMSLADTGREARAGVRMGLWGAAQALAFALGGLLGTAGSDLARVLAGATAPALAYAGVFAGVAALFVIAAGQAAHVFETRNGRSERAADLVGASAAAIARR